MGSITSSLRTWLLQQKDYVDLLQDANIGAPIVVWSDDLAIVWATRSASSLPPSLAKVIAAVDAHFSTFGFDINYSKGKTEAVLSLQGAGAVEVRKQYIHVARPGIELVLASGQETWLHFTPAYKHLGTMYTSTQTLEQELRHRLGAAKGAFSQLSRAVVCNRSYPRNLRLRLFHSLVGSRLFFGLGAWTTPSTRLLQRLRTTYIGMLKKVLKLDPTSEGWHSVRRILVMAGAGDVRAAK